MRRFITHPLLVFIFVCSIFFAPATLHAQENSQQDEIQIIEPTPRITIPGLNFTVGDKEQLIQTDENGQQYIQAPYLAQYIATGYKYIVSIASILAVLMIIVAGFQWSMSGGSPDAIGEAKKRIGGAVTGLVIAVGSYALLYAINPGLVQFRSLRLVYVQPTDLEVYYKGELSFDIVDGGTGTPGTGPAPSVPTTSRAERIICNGKEKYVPANILGISMGCDPCDVISPNRISACRIARESVVGTNNMLNTLNIYGGAGGYNSQTVDSTNCPISQGTKANINPGNTPTMQRDPTYSKYDSLFARYGNCLPIRNGDKILKSIAYAESRFQTGAISSQNFSGLFQTKPANCREAVSKHNASMAGYCSDVNDPEVSTMAGTAMVMNSIKTIEKECVQKGIPVSDTAFHAFIYIGHHGGLGTLTNLLKTKRCDYKQICVAAYEFWQNAYKGKYRDSTPPPCAQ